MTSVILRNTSRVLFPLLLLFALYLLLRGHNEPGGGFTGGLSAASAFALYALANGVGSAKRKLFFKPFTIVAAGLACAALSGVWGLLEGEPFLKGLWSPSPLPLIGKAGTPLLFDVGVFFVVIGVLTAFVFTFADEGE